MRSGPTLRLHLCCVVAVGAIAVAGCGGGGDDDEATVTSVSPADDPCALITTEQAAAAVGGPVGEGESGPGVPTSVVGEKVCQFSLADPAKPPALVRVGVATALAELVFDKFVAKRPQAVPVEDVGQRAVWDGATNTLVVLRGERVLSVVVFGGAVQQHREKALDLAGGALQRLHGS